MLLLTASTFSRYAYPCPDDHETRSYGEKQHKKWTRKQLNLLFCFFWFLNRRFITDSFLLFRSIPIHRFKYFMRLRMLICSFYGFFRMKSLKIFIALSHADNALWITYLNHQYFFINEIQMFYSLIKRNCFDNVRKVLFNN